MREILGKAKTIRELLSGVKYSVDYYQREYRWEEKQVRELIDDLTGKFLEDYRPEHKRKAVEGYGHYFLGSIIISRKDNMSFIVDGQQRLTSLTLLLIFLHRLQKEHPEKVAIEDLIYSEKYGEKSFNLHVDERMACMAALFDQQTFDDTDQPESVQNIVTRFSEIANHFPSELTNSPLPYFIDWFVENVHLVEITAYSDDDAYTIFETMNDRGLSLRPTEMLKSYLLANIDDSEQRTCANNFWKRRIIELSEVGKEVDADCFKTWLRSQYSLKIRERKKNAKPEDFDRIGTEFHRWVRDSRQAIGLNASADYLRFVDQEFAFYSRLYLRLMEASTAPATGLEHVLYNAHHGFTLQYMLLLSPLTPEDSEATITKKLRLVGRFIDILLAWRLWNFRSIAYSTMQYAMFLVMRDIRRLDPEPLAQKLRETLLKEQETFATTDRLYVHQQNGKYIHRLLARMADYIEQQSGLPSRYMEYVNGRDGVRYELEHIWADKPERHADEFPHPGDFTDYRNRIGGLLLLPKSFNASYGALPYQEKLPHYNTQNLLARSLHPLCYDHNPGFAKFISESNLPFKPHSDFRKADLDARQDLLRKLAEQIWNPDLLLQEISK